MHSNNQCTANKIKVVKSLWITISQPAFRIRLRVSHAFRPRYPVYVRHDFSNIYNLLVKSYHLLYYR